MKEIDVAKRVGVYLSSYSIWGRIWLSDRMVVLTVWGMGVAM